MTFIQNMGRSAVSKDGGNILCVCECVWLQVPGGGMGGEERKPAELWEGRDEGLECLSRTTSATVECTSCCMWKASSR